MIKSLEKAFRLIESLSRANKPMRLSDIARENGMTRSNAFTMLQTLQDLDYVRQCHDSTLYELTLKMFEIGARPVGRSGLVSVAHPVLMLLSEQAPENVILSVRDGTLGVVVDRIQSKAYVQTFAQLGARAPLHAVSGGKLLLAHAPEHIVDSVSANLKRFTDRTIVDPVALREELARIRTQGYAVTHGEINDYVKGVAYPVRDRFGLVAAALSVSGPMERLGPEKIEHYVDLLQRHAAKIEAAWPDGYSAGA